MSDSPPAAAPESSPVRPTVPPPTASRRRAVGFVVIFMVTTFALLTAFQLLSGTVWMQRYLFILAQHTAFVLNVVSDSGYLEFRSQRDLPSDQQAQIRAEIAAWQAGETPPSLPRDERAVGPPLTRWEWFQHRTLKEKADHEEERVIVEALTRAERVTVFDNAQQHIEHLVSRAEVLESSIFRPVAGGGMRERGDAEAIQTLQSAKEGLAAFTQGPITLTETSFQALLAIDQALDTARQKQLVYAKRRLGYLDEFVANSGPLVFVVWRDGLRGKVEEVRQELSAAGNDPGITEAERLEAVTRLRAEIRSLESDIAEQTKAGAPAAVIEGRRFRFTVIPSCGAIETMAIYIAAILGFPALWRKRLAGILLGIPLLYAVNVFRLACLGLIGAWFTDERVFDFAHHYAWQAIYLVFVVVVWILWLELFVRRGEKSSPADT